MRKLNRAHKVVLGVAVAAWAVALGQVGTKTVHVYNGVNVGVTVGTAGPGCEYWKDTHEFDCYTRAEN
jgi:hypothetical protein